MEKSAGSKRTITPSLQDLALKKLKNHPQIICDIIDYGIENLPEKYRDILKRSFSIDAYGCHKFVQKVNNNYFNHFFFSKVPFIKIKVRDLNSATNRRVRFHGFGGIYVPLYFTKIVYNFKKEIGHYGYVDNYATIFPFKIYESVPEYKLRIWPLLDDDFFEKMQIFVKKHFEELNIREISLLFLRNVHHFRDGHFSEMTLLRRLQRISKLSTEKLKSPDYLDTFPRLNNAGVRKYMDMHKIFEIVMKIHKKKFTPIKEYDQQYFKYLPEVNFTELYSLLDPEILNYDYNQYIYLFQKYLFFFIHASKSETKPIFFIDDALFECMKSLRYFKMCNEKSLHEKEDLLVLLSLVHMRTRYTITDENNFNINWKMLENIKSYVLNIPGLQYGQIHLKLRNDYLNGWMLLRTEDTCYDIRCAKQQRKIRNFYDRIFCSLLSEDKIIKRIVIYNPCLNEETSINMPSDLEAFRKFVRFFNNHDYSKGLSVNESLLKNSHFDFEPGTI